MLFRRCQSPLRYPLSSQNVIVGRRNLNQPRWQQISCRREYAASPIDKLKASATRQDLRWAKLIQSVLPSCYNEDQALAEAGWFREWANDILTQSRKMKRDQKHGKKVVAFQSEIPVPQSIQGKGENENVMEDLFDAYSKELSTLWSKNPDIAPLFGSCGGKTSSNQEFRWLREHVESDNPNGVVKIQNANNDKATRLATMVQLRSEGTPLQYLLGTEHFGHLTLKCEPGVLIPRQDTANQVEHIARLMHVRLDEKRSIFPEELRILDLCSGSGCMSLLLGTQIPYRKTATGTITPRVSILGLDISQKAVDNARWNYEDIKHKLKVSSDPRDQKISKGLANVAYEHVDLNDFAATLEDESKTRASLKPTFDIVLCNPPYVSEKDFQTVTNLSVRLYEPKLALVPTEDDGRGSAFYTKILQLAQAVGSKILLMEVGDIGQARVVARMARRFGWYQVEIWRDDLFRYHNNRRIDPLSGIENVGSGEGRSVVCMNKEGARWLASTGKPYSGTKSVDLHPPDETPRGDSVDDLGEIGEIGSDRGHSP